MAGVDNGRGNILITDAFKSRAVQHCQITEIQTVLRGKP